MSIAVAYSARNGMIRASHSETLSKAPFGRIENDIDHHRPHRFSVSAGL